MFSGGSKGKISKKRVNTINRGKFRRRREVFGDMLRKYECHLNDLIIPNYVYPHRVLEIQ